MTRVFSLIMDNCYISLVLLINSYFCIFLSTDVWSYWENGVKLNKIKWIPVTNTHARNPEKGVLAVKFWHYALAENGCEGLIGGTGTLTVSA